MADNSTQTRDNEPHAAAGCSRGRQRAVIKRHGLMTRVWHWVNLVCLVVLLMSGLQIFNAHPALYWGDDSSFDDPALQLTAMRDADGNPMGVTRIGSFSFNTTGVLGLSRRDGDMTQRGFPAWATLPGPQWLAMGRYWHFAAAWVFAPFLFVYLLYSLISTQRRRLIWPTAAQWRCLPKTIADHARLRFHHEADYNGLQKLTYVIVLFGLLPLMVFTGLTMSPTMNAAWPWLLDVFGGRQSARTIHFICAFGLVAFFLIHIVLVLISGVFNNLRSMITGGYKVDTDDTPPSEAKRHA